MYNLINEIHNCFTNTFTVFDIETTGYWGQQEIIELAAIKVINWKITDKYQRLIKPSRSIVKSTIEYNNITQDMVKNTNCLEEELTDFIKFLGRDILVGHNILTFDVPILNEKLQNLYGIYIQNDLIDTLNIAKEIHPELQNKQLGTLIDFYNLRVDIRHRALSDCESNLKVYKELWRESGCNLLNCNIINHYSEESYDKTLDVLDNLLKEKEIIKNILNNQEEFQIKGKTFVVSGKFDNCPLSKEEIKNQLKEIGAKVTSSVSKRTDVLLIGDNPGPTKMEKANDNNVSIIKAKDFFDKLYSYF